MLSCLRERSLRIAGGGCYAVSGSGPRPLAILLSSDGKPYAPVVGAGDGPAVAPEVTCATWTAR